MTDLLLPGRWHAVTREQETALRRRVEEAGPARLVFVITAADRSRTKRHPLTADERTEVVRALAEALGRPFEVHRVADISDSGRWVEHVRDAVRADSGGATRLDPQDTVVLSGNPDVLRHFEAAGYRTLPLDFHGPLPADLFGAIAQGAAWRDLADDGTVRVYERLGLAERVREVFADVLLTEDGELSTGRDFRVYAAGMDASMGVKLTDLCPHVLPGRIVDKGCGTGTLLVHLSALFPTSEIVGMDLSRELLRTAESQYYPNHNVSIVRGNVIGQHFPDGTLSTVLFSSVLHEVYSYNGYDRGQVRLALANTRRELRPGGRVVIRDGVSPGDGRVWMRCDEETEGRFRRFAREFKGKSAAPGVGFDERVVAGRTWFVLGLHDANEFLSKKDYLQNWAVEVNEEFGVFTLPQWRRELAALGYRVVEARGYVNPWILENRYRGKAWLHADAGDGPGTELSFPDTTAVLVGEAA
jgi:SAM-dependent methyltransferase/nicotinamide mononucleotide adenylyltransferase